STLAATDSPMPERLVIRSAIASPARRGRPGVWLDDGVSRLRRRFEKLLAPADIRLDGDRPWDPQIHDDRVFARALATGTLGIGEAYMDGWWSCDRVDILVERITRFRATRRLGSPRDVLHLARAKLTNE